MSDDDVKAELERLRSENAALKKGTSEGVRITETPPFSLTSCGELRSCLLLANHHQGLWR
jgi:hypothetical protein